jgi:cell division protein FtsN
MSQPTAIDSSRKPQWPVILIIVALVSAASLALGLMVVGPIIQRRMETPSPSLAVNVQAPPVQAPSAAPTAEVEIKEKIKPPPPPPPPQPDPSLQPGPVPATDLSQSQETQPFMDSGGSRRRRNSSAPSIRATVSDAPVDQSDRAVEQPERESTPSQERTSTSEGRDSPALEPVKPRDFPGSPSLGQPRATDLPKPRRHRSPLDALPVLGGDNVTTSNSTTGQSSAAATSGSPLPYKTYRVQVGRFTDETSAQRLRDELTGVGYTPRVVRTERNGVTIYRVQVGTFRQRENADKTVAKLKSESYEPYVADEEP